MKQCETNKENKESEVQTNKKSTNKNRSGKYSRRGKARVTYDVISSRDSNQVEGKVI